MQLSKQPSLKGELTVPGDKSISHRAVMLGSLAKGTTEITNFLQGDDCLSTIDCFRKLGIELNVNSTHISIKGKGLDGLRSPSSILEVGNSGTTTRLIAGILAAQPFESHLTGDSSIQKRPMKRIMDPLRLMGADITSLKNNGCAPLQIHGKELFGIHYTSPVASAQVKSSILLAGLYAQGKTKITEPVISRNHSEVMLRFFGGQVITQQNTATIFPRPLLEGRKVVVPGDISSAAYWIAAGLIVPNSEILLKNVGINPTRNGILQVAKEMGGNITLLEESSVSGEPTADILVKSSTLKGITISGDIIPTLIDEIPIIAVMAAYANGTTIIRDAVELKVKESNRIDVMVNTLGAMGATIQGTDDGMIITGGRPLFGTTIDSHFDHRIAMSFAIAALQAEGITKILDFECVNISYPNFYEDLARLCC